VTSNTTGTTGAGGVNPAAQAESARLRALQFQQQSLARRDGGDSMPPQSQATNAPINRDTWVNQGAVGTAAERADIFDEFDTDDNGVFSEAEFNAAFQAMTGTDAAGGVETQGNQTRPALPMQRGQTDPSYPQQGIDGKPGEDPIRELQEDLSKLTNAGGQPYFQYEGGPTGGYFKVTEAAVAAFQKDHGLPATGVVDEATYDAIQAARQQQKDGTQAKKTINDARITPPSGTADNMARQHDANLATLKEAQKALEMIPPNDPERAAYEQKVAELESDFKEFWPGSDAGIADPAAVAAAKQSIDGASITGTRPTGGSPDRIEDMANRDRSSLESAQKALESIPADDPQYAEYKQKVQELQSAYETKWWAGETGANFRDAQATIDRITSNPPDAATLSVNGQCHTSPEVYGQALQKSISELEEALAVLPDNDPIKAQLKAKVDSYVEAAANAQPTAEQLLAHRTRELEKELSERAGHPVNIKFEEGAFSPEDQMKQLNLLSGALESEYYTAEMWAQFNTIEFNTYENYRNDSNPNNLNKYTEVSGNTLRINNPDRDGITPAELDKQRRALDYTLRNGQGS